MCQPGSRLWIQMTVRIDGQFLFVLSEEQFAQTPGEWNNWD